MITDPPENTEILMPRSAERELKSPERWGQPSEISDVLFIHAHVNTSTEEYIPCRHGTLIRQSRVVGSTIQLRVRLDEFAYSENLTQFTNELRERTNSTLKFNFRTGESDDQAPPNEPTCIVTKCVELPTIFKTLELEKWESLVTQFKQSQVFGDVGLFYRIDRIENALLEEPNELVDGVLQLTSGNRYRMDVYHFDPTALQCEGTISVEKVSDNIQFSSNPTLRVYCPYDAKSVQFRTDAPLRGEDSFLSVHQRSRSTDGSEYQWQCDLQYKLQGSWAIKIGLALAVGTLLSISSLRNRSHVG